MSLEPRSYSTRTVCPACDQKVPLEDVRFTKMFSCPMCNAEIRVAATYKQIQNTVSYAVGFSIPYFLGVRRGLLFCEGVVLTFFVAFVQSYVVKYVLPPKLVFGPKSGFPTLRI